MKYLSVCSGIEAATSAWHHMGWEPVAFSEIEPFPSAVLKHHYPNVPNLGDMTKFKEWNLGSIDLLVGGTPCQSFSVAGLRKGLDDPRGNLMLTFGAIARHFAPRWLVWENVPGVLSSNGGRDFGTFLGMLGELGYGFAYRVLDAQYFGVAQRRRRVFVVGCLGNWRAAAAVLFELASMSGNPPPSREKGQGVTPGSPPGPQYGGSNAECADTVTSKWAKGSGGPSGNEGGLFVAQPVGLPEVMSTLLSSTAGVSRPGNAATEHETYIPMAYRKSKRAHTQDDDETWVDDGIANTVNLFDQGDTRTTHAVVQPIPLDSMNIFRSPEADASTGCGLGEEGEAMFTLTKTNHHAVAQPLNIYGGNKRSDRPEGGFYVRMNEDTSKTLDATSGLNPTANQGGTAVMQPVVFQETADPLTACFAKHHGASGGKDSIPHNHVMQSMAVRRLTPRECERLQGFSDDHTLIPWRGKDASQCPDGPRYKALGNSMAVPVMAWIGERIRMVCELQK